MLDFIQNVTINIFKGYGNILFNGFAFDIPKKEREKHPDIQYAHFQITTSWDRLNNGTVIDLSTKDEYSRDDLQTIRFKCTAIFIASWIAQPIGLSLSIINKVVKIAILAHFWKPSQEDYSFEARISEWKKDLFVIVATPLILLGMLAASLYGATASAYDGRKLFASCERLAYSGGYQVFPIQYEDYQRYLLAPCFQPKPTAHLGGGDLNQQNAW